MARFLWILLAFTALSQIVPALAAANLAAHAHLARPWAWGAAVFVYGVGLFIGRARSRMTDVPRPWLFLVFIDEPYFVHWCASLFATLASIFVIATSPVVDVVRGVPIRFPIDGVTITYIVGFAMALYGIVYRRRHFVTRRVDVAIEGLHEDFDGYRIVQLSDLHIGALTPKPWGMRWVRAANALAADLAVVTGDMVTSGTAFHADIADIVGSLKAKDGVVVSMGNHDYFGGDGEPLMSLLHRAGVRVMRNEGDVLERGAGKVYLAAIDDTWTRRADLEAALRDRPEGVPTILLAHDPDEFRAAAKRDVDLVLSGHTHGGQVAIPFFARNYNLSKLSHHYHLGLYRRGKSTLYVHPGLGTTGPPVRFGVAPAIVELTLRRA
jgi:predicted MPP superfamily phosphohydrolase